MVSSPVIIVNDNEATVSTSESDLVASVVPPVGEGLTVHHVTEGHHVPDNTMSSCYEVP